MYSNSKFVLTATFQNITTTLGTLISITTDAISGGVAFSVNNALLLNAGQAVNTGGGSKTVNNVDLAQFNWTATNTNDCLMVYYEVGNNPVTGIGFV